MCKIFSFYILNGLQTQQLRTYSGDNLKADSDMIIANMLKFKWAHQWMNE